MADAAAVKAMEALHSCRCCLRRPPDKGLKTLYENVGKTENYWDMLKECFNIHLNVGNDECGICEVCVARLRDATEFKMQVQQSQVELKALLEKALQEKEKKPSLIKVELVEEDPNVEEVMIQDDGPVKSELGDGDIVSSLLSSGESSDAESVTSEFEHNNSPFNCQKRLKTLALQANLAKHMERLKTIANRANLAKHKALHAKGSVASETKALSGGDSSDAESVMSESEDNNSQTKSQECHATFDLGLSLTKHMDVHAIGSVATETETLLCGESSDAESVISEYEDNNSPFKCQECQKTFDLKNNLTKHMAFHAKGSVATETKTLSSGDSSDAESVISESEDNNSPIKSQKCEESFELGDSLTKQMDVHARGSVATETRTLSNGDLSDAESVMLESEDNNSPIQYQECQKTLDLGASLTKHMDVHARGSVATETKTLSSGDSSDAESVMSKTEDNDSPIKSQEYQETFYLKDSLTKRIAVHAIGTVATETKTLLSGESSHAKSSTLEPDDNNSLFKCQECQKTFDLEHSLTKHMAVHAIGSIATGTEPLLSEESPNAESVMSESEENNSPFKYQECQDTFDLEDCLTKHMAVHAESSATTEIKTHMCGVCCEIFGLYADLTKHMEIHDDLRRGLCKKTLSNQNNLNQMGIHTREKLYSCEVCNKKFGHKHHMKRHMQSHKRDIFSCQVCPKKFAEESQLKEHELLHTEIRTDSCNQIHDGFRCGVCKKVLRTRSGLQYHMGFHTAEKPYFCELCDKKFGTILILKKHVKCCHKGEDQRQILSKNFAEQSHLKEHVQENKTKKPYVCEYKCDFCCQIFKLKTDLAKHIHKEHMETTVLRCGLCKKILANKNSLKVHMTTHTGEKPYSCQVCSMKFRQKHHLKSHHMRSHKGEYLEHVQENKHKKPYVCEYKCDFCCQIFKLKTDLAKHIHKEHIETTDLRCGLCKKILANKNSLKVHMTTHTGEKPYSCQVCSMKFRQKHHLKSHHMRSHKGEYSISSQIRPEKFTDQTELRKHVLVHTELRNDSCENTCNVCCERFEQKNDLTNHMEIHNQGGLPEKISTTKESSVKEKLYSCEICNRQFRHNHHLEQHMTSHQRKHRREISSKNFAEQSHLKEHAQEKKVKKTYVCVNKCDYCCQSFKLNTDLTKHIHKTHIETKDLRCGLCKKIFANKGNLKDHMITHTGQKPYSCQVCSMKFRYKQSLKCHHMKSHKGEYLFFCRKCPKQFTNQIELKKHGLEHAEKNTQTYTCETCKKGFGSNIHLQIHLLDHKKEEPHTCQICKKKFYSKSLLYTHVKTHIDKSHTCEICDAKFKNKKKLRSHLTTHINKSHTYVR